MQLHKFLRCDDGGAAIEMGVLFPLFLLLTTGGYDLGVETVSMMAVSNAVQAGAAYGVLHPADAVSGGSGISAAMNAASGGLTINASATLVNGVLTVTGKYSYPPVTLISWSANPKTLSATATIRLE
jgi:Flp pilus assembly protein TadG